MRPTLASRTHVWSIFMDYTLDCDLSYFGGIIELRKLDFRGLEDQFYVKIGQFRGG